MRTKLAVAALACFAVAVVAAPLPFVEKQSLEAVLETGNPQRAEALKRWLKAPDLLRDLLPRESSWPKGFADKLRIEVQEGGRLVTLHLPAGRPVAERALFRQLVARVTRPATGPERAAEVVAQEEQLKAGVAVWRGKKAWAAYSYSHDEASMWDQNIRQSPPRLVPRAGR